MNFRGDGLLAGGLELPEFEPLQRIRKITVTFLPIETEIPYQDSLETSVCHANQRLHSLNFDLNLPPSARFRPFQLPSDSKPPGHPSLGCDM